jgi:hypothetical protein
MKVHGPAQDTGVEDIAAMVSTKLFTELVRDQLSVKEGRTAASTSTTKTILLKDRSAYFDDKDLLLEAS